VRFGRFDSALALVRCFGFALPITLIERSRIAQASGGNSTAFALRGDFMRTVGVMWLTHRLDVPTWIERWVGRIAIAWASLEYEFEETIRLVLDMGIKQGRIIAVGMNLRSRIACAQSLIAALALEDDRFEPILAKAKSLMEEIEHYQPERDKYVHAIWARHADNWYIIRSSGSRRLDPIGKVKRAVLPEKELVTLGALRKVRIDAMQFRVEMDLLRQEIASLLPPSRNKSPKHMRQGRLHPVRKKTTHDDQQ
jgi:hypothetical protein